MMSLIDLKRPKHIVHAAQFYRFTIYRGCPFGVEYLGKDHNSARCTAHIIRQLVGLVGREPDNRRAILHFCLAKLTAEACIGHRFMAQIKRSELVEFRICIVNISDFIHEPCVPIDVRIADWHRLFALQRHNKVFGIEHIQHREDAVAIDFGHVSACFCNGRHRLLHLRTDVSINQFLVSSELSCMISADTFMVIRGLVLVECVACKVQNAIIQGLVLQDLSVGLRHRLGLFAHASLHKHAVIQVAFVHLPHVDEAQNGYRSHHIHGLQFLETIEEEEQCADGNQPKRPPTIGRKDAFADASQVRLQRRKIVRRD